MQSAPVNVLKQFFNRIFLCVVNFEILVAACYQRLSVHAAAQLVSNISTLNEIK